MRKVADTEVALAHRRMLRPALAARAPQGYHPSMPRDKQSERAVGVLVVCIVTTLLINPSGRKN
jgi:hypothetical protein